MKNALFYHSLLSDWNHGNAHFLRGIASELIRRGHEVAVYEAENNWSLRNLLQYQGTETLTASKPALPLRPHIVGGDAQHGRRAESLCGGRFPGFRKASTLG